MVFSYLLCCVFGVSLLLFDLYTIIVLYRALSFCWVILALALRHSLFIYCCEVVTYFPSKGPPELTEGPSVEATSTTGTLASIKSCPNDVKIVLLDALNR